MNHKDLLQECRDTMDKRIASMARELTRVRTGRANPAMLDGVRVPYWGNPTPLAQVASLATPDARTLVINPFEKNLIPEIERALHMADLGMQPSSDGKVVRLLVPPLTEERRRDIAKQVKKIGEDAKVSVRKVRQDINHKIRTAEKAKEIAEDVAKKMQKEVQELTDTFVALIDTKVKEKETEVMTV